MRHQFLLGAAVVALAIPAAASAQETTSSIRGTVTNAGAPVAGATVVATDVASGTKSQGVTGDDGAFVLPGLRPGGPYTVEVTSTLGSKSVTDIYTVVAQSFELPVELAAADGAATTGQIGNEVVVTASSIAGAGTTATGPRTVLTQRDISKVASVNRDVRDLERRDPFATLDLSNSRAVSFAGVNPRFNRFTINGVQVGDNFGLNSDVNPTGRGPIPFDAISQFSVSVAPWDIRQGNFIGGSINTVMLSGTNEFHGTGFYSQSTDELQGKRIGNSPAGNLTSTGTNPLPNYKSETYGATLAGPLIADRLFFMVSAERNTDPRPLSVASLAQIPNYNAVTLGQVMQAATAARYGNYTTGGFITINNQKDEKIVGRIDANITTGQRLSLSYINAFEQSTIANGTSTSTTAPVIGLASNYYQRSNLLRAGIVQLNSDWTDHLSTETRVLYRYVKTGQDSLLGTGYPQIRVCTDQNSINVTGNTTTTCGTNPIVAFGPDNSRQTNILFNDQWGGSFLARYTGGGHEIKLLAEYNELRTFNLFLQNSAGSYYFDSITDFQNGNANAYNLQVPVNGDINSVAANFHYGQYTFGLQDDWAVTDTLRISAGVRYDLYGMRDQVPFNAAYQARYGFPNTKTYKGLDNFQPRISANWRAADWLRLRTGVGIFGGGSPDIYLSNSFSNTGVVANALNSSTTGFGIIRSGTGAQTCTGAFTGTLAPVCLAALNNVQAPAIPGAVVNYLATNTAALATAPSSSLSPNIHLPQVLKATFSADATFRGVDIGGDFLYTNTLHAPSFTDIRARPVGLLPDGRPRYAPITSVTDANSDYFFYDDSRGRSFVAVARVQKSFDFGLSMGGSYTFQDVKDVSPATASTPGSLFGQQASGDPNFPVYGISSDQTKWAFKYNVGFDHAFFGDYRTVVQLFGETRAGRPYSFTMQDPSGQTRSTVFGTAGNSDRYLLYVPTGLTDPKVSYADAGTGTALVTAAQTQAALDALINGSDLKNYRGQIAAKNIARSRAFTRIDLHLEQELPTGLGGSRVVFFGDIENLPNLLNHNWGGLRQLGFPYTSSVVQVQCVSAAGVVLSGNVGTATNPAAGCAQYRYSSYRAPNTGALSVTNSLYLIRVGARFRF